MLKLSILDQSPIPDGQSAQEALKTSLELAKLADSLGYHRYWLAEHHSTTGLASVSPEVLISHLAAKTSRIRIGSGGVLLSHYSSYKVAENFRLLESLYPGRIDLGIGRAPGGDPRTAIALADGLPRSPEAFPRQVKDLLSYLSDGTPTDAKLAGLRATPMTMTSPPVWLLGSSNASAAYAAEFGTAFSFAHFINASSGPDVVRNYLARFQPSDQLSHPKASVCVFVVCAETDEEAAREALSLEYWLVKLSQGKSDGIPSVEEAEAFTPVDWEVAHMQENRRKMIVGSPETVRAGLEYMADEYGTDEIMIITNIHNQQARLKSYQLIAEVFDLNKTKEKALKDYN